MLEVAVEVARAGASASPVVAPPSELEPILRFSKLTGPALDVVRRALDDDGFRHRVLDEAPAGRLDAVGLLVLGRPSGWQAAVVRLAGPSEPEADTSRDDAALRRAERRLAAAEDARARAESTAASERARGDEARADLAQERDAHRRTTAEVRTARSSDADARRRLEEAERELDVLRVDLEAAHRLATDLRGAGAADERLDPDAVDAVLAGALAETEALRSALDDVRSGASEVAEALRRARSEIAVRRASHDDASRTPTDHLRSRVPVPPPPGLSSDAHAAVAALLATPRLVVLVDGYNVTIGRWGADLTITDQRGRLEQLASSAAARLGVEVWLVFDGADVAPPPRRPRSLIRVLFSAPDEEADDVVIRLTAELPPDRPVAVVSDDNRVRRGAAASGANLVTVDAFIEAVRPPS